jgi:hypothetical protein
LSLYTKPLWFSLFIYISYQNVKWDGYGVVMTLILHFFVFILVELLVHPFYYHCFP